MLFGQMKVIGTLHLVNKHKRTKLAVDPRKPATVDVFIGRPSVLGNDYVIGRDGDRDEVCDKYDAGLDRHVKVKNKTVMRKLQYIRDLLDEGHDVCLVCFCAPERCHGLSVIKQVERLRKRKAKS